MILEDYAKRAEHLYTVILLEIESTARVIEDIDKFWMDAKRLFDAAPEEFYRDAGAAEPDTLGLGSHLFLFKRDKEVFDMVAEGEVGATMEHYDRARRMLHTLLMWLDKKKGIDVAY